MRRLLKRLGQKLLAFVLGGWHPLFIGEAVITIAHDQVVMQKGINGHEAEDDFPGDGPVFRRWLDIS